MSTNRLPTTDDGYRMSVRFKDTFGNREFFLFPLDWGAARVADLVDAVRREVGINYIRYDLPVSPYSNGLYRRVTKPGSYVRNDLESGKTLTNTQSGPVYTEIRPVDFDISRDAVILEDWLGFTGQGLQGGSIWGIRNREILNLRSVYPAALEAFRGFELPEGYTRWAHLVGELLLPYDTYPLIRVAVGNHE